MIEVTGTAAKHAWNANILPPVEQVAPLVWSIPIVYPESSVRYTFCYVLTAPSGECVVLDPGGYYGGLGPAGDRAGCRRPHP